MTSDSASASFEIIAVVGLGYVGLPLSIRFAESCATVIGIDIDPAKIEQLNRGESYIKHINADALGDLVKRKKFQPTNDFARVRECSAVIICVPTPLTKTREPDLSYVLNTGRAIAPHLQPGTLVVLESTSYPGTTDEDLKAVLEEHAPLVEDDADEVGSRKSEVGGRKSEGDAGDTPATTGGSQLSTIDSQLVTAAASAEKLKQRAGDANNQEQITNNPPGRRMQAGRDFHLAFSPEREDPGNANSSIGNIPKIVGGLTEKCRDKAVALYSRAVEKVVSVSSCKVAEAAKLLENIFRSVNIALVNELKVIYAAMGIDIWEVIEAAKTKPFGFMPFYPGPGLGGHCIPIDPFYLAWKAREFGKPTRFIELAGEINTAMPDYVVQKVSEALNSQQKSIKGSKILLVGLAYKADVDDMRESPTFVLMDKLSSLGAEVGYYDPHIPVIGATREHMKWHGMRSVDWNEATIRTFAAAVIVTAHRAVDYKQLATWCDCVVDTRNVFSGATSPAAGPVIKA